MPAYRKKVMEAAAFLRNRIDITPRIGLLTGTGLGESGGSLSISETFTYEGIPHFPVSTVKSHAGRLLAGRIGQCPAVVMQGRFHLYEGYTPAEVVFPIRVMKALGVEFLVLTNASGGLDATFRPGDIMVIQDHINLTGDNPLVGPNEESWGERFPDMGQAYDRQLIGLVAQICGELKIPVRKGVYAGLKGPSLETPAEVKFLKSIGADAVGFSTVQEVIAAVHARMNVLGLSTITNVHDPDHPEPANVDDIIAVAESAAPVIDRIVRAMAGKIDP
jgi:purine-nucleoside phosphorylase